MSSLSQVVAINIAILRKLKMMSQKELSEKANISLTIVSMIEQGDGNPTLTTLHRIAKALDVNVTTLFNDHALIEIYGEEIQNDKFNND